MPKCFDAFGKTFGLDGANCDFDDNRALTCRSSIDETRMKLFSGHIIPGRCVPEAEAPESALTVTLAVLLTLIFE